MIAFIATNGGSVPSSEGLCAQILCYRFEIMNYVPRETFTDNPVICARILDRETFFSVIVQLHKMSQMSHHILHRENKRLHLESSKQNYYNISF